MGRELTPQQIEQIKRNLVDFIVAAKLPALLPSELKELGEALAKPAQQLTINLAAPRAVKSESSKARSLLLQDSDNILGWRIAVLDQHGELLGFLTGILHLYVLAGIKLEAIELPTELPVEEGPGEEREDEQPKEPQEDPKEKLDQLLGNLLTDLKHQV
jgi:hypothetical protein